MNTAKPTGHHNEPPDLREGQPAHPVYHLARGDEPRRKGSHDGGQQAAGPRRRPGAAKGRTSREVELPVAAVGGQGGEEGGDRETHGPGPQGGQRRFVVTGVALAVVLGGGVDGEVDAAEGAVQDLAVAQVQVCSVLC